MWLWATIDLAEVARSGMTIIIEHIVIPASFSKVFDYIANPSNLPRWSVNFIFMLSSTTDGKLVVKTPVGERILEVQANKTIGTIDFIYLSDGKLDMRVPTRVLAVGEVTCFLFTLFLPDMPQQEISRARAGLRQELQMLCRQLAQPKRIRGARHTNGSDH
jgi:hypothetical protein